MENLGYYPYPNPNNKPDDLIVTILKWGTIGMGFAWLLNELLGNTEGCEEHVNTDTIDVENGGEQPTVMDTKTDSDTRITTYGDLACEIERLRMQIEVLNKEIERLKIASRNPQGGFNEDLLKKLAKIVFDQKVIRERLARLMNVAV